MAMDGLRVLAVVPARGGSKGIPRKNLQLVGGLSLVGRAANVISALPWIDAAVLSTDDDEIATEAERHGLAAPFRRPAELSNDTATSVDMWRHAWLAAEALNSIRFDVSILLEPTSPLRTATDVERTVKDMVEGGHEAAATVSRTAAHFTPEKALISDQGVLQFYLRDKGRYLRQDIPPYFHRNGVCYAVRRETLIEHGAILERDCVPVVIEREVVNIDEPFELEYAEWLDARSRSS